MLVALIWLRHCLSLAPNILFLILTFYRPGPRTECCDGIIWPFIWVWSHLWVFSVHSVSSILAHIQINNLNQTTRVELAFCFPTKLTTLFLQPLRSRKYFNLIETEKVCEIKIEHYVQPFWILIILAGEGRGESLIWFTFCHHWLIFVTIILRYLDTMTASPILNKQ